MIEFEEFRRKAEERGATARDCGSGHWQVRGPLTVNYYPARGTIFVNGTSRSIDRGSPDTAIACAFQPPSKVRLEDRMSDRKRRAEKRRLLGISAFCHWCRCTLTPETATLEHVVPLARQGTNRRENLALSCAPCNGGRGHAMPELRG